MNEQLVKKLDTIFHSETPFIDENGFECKSSKNQGVTGMDIASVIASFPVRIPEDYVEFLKYTNGCTLFNYRDLDGFHFFGTGELNRKNDFLKDLYEEDWDSSVVVICSTLGDGDYIVLRVLDGDHYEILDGFHEYNPSQWAVIGTSFDKFLEKLIDLGGKKFWLSPSEEK